MTERRILMVVFEGFELLDLAGPSSVFTTASDLLGRPAYATVPISLAGGPVTSSAAIQVYAAAMGATPVTDQDTVLVCGGGWEALRRAGAESELVAWVGRASEAAERYGSVCAGAVVLAHTGRLDGRRATTHWAALDHLREARPEIDLSSDALYVRDGRSWTSAGVATGIDMALAMVEADYGVGLMGEVAKRLVVYARRPGHQSQYSAVLDAQVEAGDELGDVVAWVDAHLGESIRVAELAEQAGLSERTFYRRFVYTTGRTPARYIEEARMVRARTLLEEGGTVKGVAHSVGYASEAGFRKVFQNRFGVSPSLYRSLSRSSAQDPG